MKKHLIKIITVLFAAVLTFSSCAMPDNELTDVSVEWDKVDMSSLNDNGGELKFNVVVSDLKAEENENKSGIKVTADIVIAYRNKKGEISKHSVTETFDEFGIHELKYQVGDLADYNGIFIESVKCTVKSYNKK